MGNDGLEGRGYEYGGLSIQSCEPAVLPACRLLVKLDVERGYAAGYVLGRRIGQETDRLDRLVGPPGQR